MRNDVNFFLRNESEQLAQFILRICQLEQERCVNLRWFTRCYTYSSPGRNVRHVHEGIIVVKNFVGMKQRQLQTKYKEVQRSQRDRATRRVITRWRKKTPLAIASHEKCRNTFAHITSLNADRFQNHFAIFRLSSWH